MLNFDLNTFIELMCRRVAVCYKFTLTATFDCDLRFIYTMFNKKLFNNKCTFKRQLLVKGTTSFRISVADDGYGVVFTS